MSDINTEYMERLLGTSYNDQDAVCFASWLESHGWQLFLADDGQYHATRNGREMTESEWQENLDACFKMFDLEMYLIDAMSERGSCFDEEMAFRFMSMRSPDDVAELISDYWQACQGNGYIPEGDIDDVDIAFVANSVREIYRERFTDAVLCEMPENTEDKDPECPSGTWSTPWKGLNPDAYCVREGLTVEEMAEEYIQKVFGSAE